MNRFHYFFLGLVILFLGVEFRLVDSFVLNERATNMIADQTGNSPVGPNNPLRAFMPSAGPLPRKTMQAPPWLGWCLLSFGGVLVLHSLAMPKPGQ
jgi:hypothetical protein